MAPKIQFTEAELTALIKTFDEIVSRKDSVLTTDIPELFFKTTNKKVSYRLLKQKYDEVTKFSNRTIEQVQSMKRLN